jgi:hypothetical protein
MLWLKALKKLTRRKWIKWIIEDITARYLGFQGIFRVVMQEFSDRNKAL